MLTRNVPQELRHYCRNPRCRMRLAERVDNPRRAFCCRGCRESFYLKRCLVCEGPLTNEQAKVCGLKCRNEYQRFPHRFQQAKQHQRPQVAKTKSDPSETPILRASKRASDANLRRLKDEIAALSARAIFQRSTPPLNLIGGYPFPGTPAIDLSPPTNDTVDPITVDPITAIEFDGDPLEIPPFLRRAVKRRAAS